MKPVAPLAAIAVLGLSSCATVPPGRDGLAWARIGQTVYVDGPRVRPEKVLEDSRCPADVQCFWAGRVRILAQVTTGPGSELRELTLREPVPVADGTLELVEVRPETNSRRAIPLQDYRFGLRFRGGL